jgi:hypothetical protein
VGRLARAQRRTGDRLDQLERIGARVLHDRRIPPSYLQIPHLIAGRWGVTLVLDVTPGQAGRAEDDALAGSRLQMVFGLAERLPDWTIPVRTAFVLHGARGPGPAAPPARGELIVGRLADVIAQISALPGGLAPHHVAELATVLDQICPVIPLDAAQTLDQLLPHHHE